MNTPYGKQAAECRRPDGVSNELRRPASRLTNTRRCIEFEHPLAKAHFSIFHARSWT
jgi:hypothetical protein